LSHLFEVVVDVVEFVVDFADAVFDAFDEVLGDASFLLGEVELVEECRGLGEFLFLDRDLVL
jgi:hypothetical protein